MANYYEQFFGDLSDDYTDPTAHENFPGELVLFKGSNIVQGTTKGGGGTADDPDFFTFTVPTGYTVSDIVLTDYQWGNGNQSIPAYGDSYFAVTTGGQFSTVASAADYTISKLIDDYAAEGSEVGQDLLSPSVGNAVGPAGTGQLGPETYSVWYQETGADTSYTFDIKLRAPVTAKPGVVQFSSDTYSVNEDAGTVDIKLVRTGGSDGGVSVKLGRTGGGTAQNLSDYFFHPVSATFKHGETEKIVSIKIKDDVKDESTETVKLTLSNPKGGVGIGTTSQSTLNIVDDDGSLTTPLPKPITYEAEDMTLSGKYAVEDNDFASGGKLIWLNKAPNGSKGEASTVFDGANGNYDIEVKYVDENDGNAQLQLKLDDALLGSWTLDEELGDGGATAATFTEKLISGVELEKGDVLTIVGTKNVWENARVDYIKLTPVSSGKPGIGGGITDKIDLGTINKRPVIDLSQFDQPTVDPLVVKNTTGPALQTPVLASI